MRTFRIVLLLLILGLGVPWQAQATHNRAGEITYQQIGELTYRITVITYTASGPGPVADRPELEVQFGDGTLKSVKRVEEIKLPDFYKRNKYVWDHTYPGPGTYQILVEDPNRNQGVKNIPNSVNVVFSIKTILIINPEIGYNNTPILNNPPIDKAALGYPFIHNPAAFDPDGDSLSYKLAICTAENGQEIEGYTFPAFTDSLVVDEITGDLIWASPSDTGKYNVAMTIEEWRNGVQIGRIQRDMQIEVYVTDNQPPQIMDYGQFCIQAGEFFEFQINATDPDKDSIAMEARGGPMLFEDNPADFRQVFGTTGKSIAKFSWQTACSQVRVQPYLVIIKAKDNHEDLPLIDSKNLELFVHAPAPENLTAVGGSASITLNWEACPCNNHSGYRIYRRVGSRIFEPDSCETGMPEELGYQLIAQIDSPEDLDYIDNNNGFGLQQASEYCYRISAVYPDGAESFISNEACATLVKGSPEIIQVSVIETDKIDGEISIKWLLPDLSEFDNPVGPFRYRIYRSEGMFGLDPVLVDSLEGFNQISFIDQGINTQEIQWSYQVELVSAEPGNYQILGTPQVASSIFLKLTPAHAALTLNYVKNVPWNIEHFSIFSPNFLQGDSLGQTESLSYRVDLLEDGTSYCFQVVGQSENSILPYQDRKNLSQIACGVPMDTLPPCPPILTGKSVCDSLANYLKWNNVNDSCAFDAKYYKLYYKTSLEGEMVFLDSTLTINDTEYWHYPAESLAACYAVTAVDSVGNESERSNLICLDECINYKLPNVFTPNGDGYNDLLRPYPYNLVDKIELKIFSRWGNTVYETNNPDINWDGKHFITGKKVSSGVYYYVCDVYEKRLTGIEPRYLVGFIHVLYGGSGDE